MSKIITYDLRAPGRNYQKLYDAIEQYPVHAKINESCWVVGSSSSANEIMERLAACIDANDRIFVATLVVEAAWINAIDGDDEVKGAIRA